MTDRPDWEQPVAGRRLPVWVWVLAGIVLVAVSAQLARPPAEVPLPGLPVEVIERPLPRPDLVPALRPVPHPSDRWEVLDPAPNLLSELGPAVWTGDALVAWSGVIEVLWEAETGAWRVPTGGATVQRDSGWTATWTGSEILYFGGVAGDAMPSEVWGFEPAANRWRLGAAAPIVGRTDHSAAWDGQRLHVWGGRSQTGALLADGASYDPVTDSWTVMPPGPLDAREAPEARWLAETQELVFWGGSIAGQQFVDGAAYRPADGSWRRIPDAPWEFLLGAAVTDDGQRRLYLWGLPAAGLHLPDGVVYDAVEDAWEALPDLLDQERAGASAALIEDGGLLVVWGGLDRRLEAPRLDGFVLDLDTGRWRQIPPAPLLSLGDPHVAYSLHPAREGLLVWGARPGSGAAFYPAPLLREPLVGTGPASR